MIRSSLAICQLINALIGELKWLSSFVTGRTQAVVFNGDTSSPVKLVCGVPQGSTLVRCGLYRILPMKWPWHCITRTNLFIRWWNMSAVRLSTRMQHLPDSGVTNINGSLSSNRLKFNADKTEDRDRQQLLKFTRQSLNINDVSLAPVSKVR